MDAMVTSIQQPSRGRFGGPLPLWGGGTWQLVCLGPLSGLQPLCPKPSGPAGVTQPEVGQILPALLQEAGCCGPAGPGRWTWAAHWGNLGFFPTPRAPLLYTQLSHGPGSHRNHPHRPLTTQAVHSPDQAEEQLRDPNSMKIHLSAVPVSARPPAPRRLYRLYRGTSGGRGTPGLLRAQSCPGT